MCARESGTANSSTDSPSHALPTLQHHRAKVGATRQLRAGTPTPYRSRQPSLRRSADGPQLWARPQQLQPCRQVHSRPQALVTLPYTTAGSMQLSSQPVRWRHLRPPGRLDRTLIWAAPQQWRRLLCRVPVWHAEAGLQRQEGLGGAGSVPACGRCWQGARMRWCRYCKAAAGRSWRGCCCGRWRWCGRRGNTRSTSWTSCRRCVGVVLSLFVRPLSDEPLSGIHADIAERAGYWNTTLWPSRARGLYLLWLEQNSGLVLPYILAKPPHSGPQFWHLLLPSPPVQALELQGSLQAQLHAQKLEGARLYRSLMALRDMRSSGGGAGEDPGPDPLPLALGHRLALSAVGAGGWSGGPAAAAGGGAGTNGLPPALLRDLGSDVDMEEGGDGGGVYDGDGMALPAGGSSLSHTLAVEGDTEQHRSDLGMLQRKEGAAGAVAAGRLAERRDARASWNGMAADGVAATDVAAMAAAFARAGSAAAGMGVPIGLRSAAGADEGDDAGRGCSPAARAASHGPTVSGGHERPRSELSCLSGHFGQPHVGQGEQEGGEEAQGEEDRVHLSGCGGLAGFASRAAVIASPAQASGVAREALSRLGEGVTQRDAVPGETVRLQQHGQPQNDPSLRQRTAQGWDRWSAAEAAAMGSAGRNPVLAGAGRATAGASPGNRSDPDAAKHRYTPCPGAAADAQAVVVKAEPGCGAAGGPGATGPVKPGLLGPGAAAGAAPYSDGGSGSSSAF